MDIDLWLKDVECKCGDVEVIEMLVMLFENVL